MTLSFAYKLVISYDGTDFVGWQIQPNGIAIQQLVQNALSTVLRTLTYATGSSRTDAGVHALGQCAHFHTAEPVDINRLCNSLNGILPPAIRIQTIEAVSPSFHARYSAKKKLYRYYLTLTRYANPITRLYSWHIPNLYDIERAEQAIGHLIGTRDFTSFTNTGGHGRDNCVRTLYRIEGIPTPDGLCYEFEGNGFLYKMVRNLVATLIAIGTGKLQGEALPTLLAARDRRLLGETAPPHGLFLVRIDY